MSKETVSFEELVRAWLLHYDDRLPTDRKERREAFIILLGNLKDHGYTKEDLTTQKKEKIIRSCVNPNHRNKSKLRKWLSILVNDLEAASLIFYGSIKIREDIVTEEMREKLENMDKKAEETRALRTIDNGEEDNENISAYDKTLEVRDVIQQNNDKEIPDEMLEEMDGPEIVWDEDFLDKLEKQ